MNAHNDKNPENVKTEGDRHIYQSFMQVQLTGLALNYQGPLLLYGFILLEQSKDVLRAVLLPHFSSSKCCH